MFGACTLRAAVEEANALAGADRIFIGAGTIVLGAPELSITDEVTIEGAGARATNISHEPIQDNRMFKVEAGARVTLRDLALRNGSSGPMVNGSAVSSSGQLTIDRVWFDRNQTHSCGALVVDGGAFQIVDSAFTGNLTNQDSGIGGAVCVYGSVDFTITSTTFQGNSSARGGALYVNTASGSGLLRNSTFVDNRDTGFGPQSSALFVKASTFQLDKNLIVGTCIYFQTVLISDGGNIESPGSTCLVGAAGDLDGVTRQQLHLGTLGDYGGPVPTILPGTQSLAVEPPLSAASCPPFDARGEPRVGRCDVGAAERQLDDPESGPLFLDGFEAGDVASWSFFTL
jgi:predicted outer membrane repeat protein